MKIGKVLTSEFGAIAKYCLHLGSNTGKVQKGSNSDDNFEILNPPVYVILSFSLLKMKAKFPQTG